MGNAQYNRLAALNNIIMVYPDTRCWNNDEDPDGIDHYNYNKKTGILPTAIKAMIDRVTGGMTDGGGDSQDDTTPDPESDYEDEDTDGDFDDIDTDEDEPDSDLATWLEEQTIPDHDGTDCISDFRITSTEGEGARLFHGTDCESSTLVSELVFPAGTWGSDAISAFSQEPDSPCLPVDDFSLE